MIDQMKIRTASGQDAEAILAMIIKHAQFEGDTFEPEGKLEKLKAALDVQQLFECWVVEIKGVIEGYCSFMPHYDSWHQYRFLFVDALWLNEHVRGGSIGSKIFDKLHARAKDLQCDTIQVMTPSTNSSGISFYKKLGAVQMSKAYFSFPVRP